MEKKVKEAVKKLSDMSINDLLGMHKLKEVFVKQYPNEPERGAMIYEREIGYAKMLFANPKNTTLKGYAEKNMQSLYVAMVELAYSQLSLNPKTAQTYLIPRGNAVMLDISYLGKLELLIRQGGIAQVKTAEVIYSHEEYLVENGEVQHNITFPRGKHTIQDVIAAYVIAIMPDGSERHVIMDIEEIFQRKEMSFDGNKKGGVWEKWYKEMCIKCVLHKLFKMMPKSSKSEVYAKLFEASYQREQEVLSNPEPEQIQATQQAIEEGAPTAADLANDLDPNIPFD